MATKLEKLQATQLNLQLAQSKFETLRQRDREISLKIERLNAERSAIQLKATNLKAQIEKLQIFLNNQRRG